jgi:hypothetical protein
VIDADEYCERNIENWVFCVKEISLLISRS